MKHLVYLIDGTWLFAGDSRANLAYSNIYRMNMFLKRKDVYENEQITHYVRGIGSTQNGDDKLAGGFAFGINEAIEDIYINICSNFDEGDKIYIFGFSRGAVIARALTGLLSYGILRTDAISLMPHLWNCFKSARLDDTLLGASTDDSSESFKLVKKHIHAAPASVEFLGVFETVVGGNGNLREFQSLNLHRSYVAPCVKTAIHLLALDETRPFFEHVSWKGKINNVTEVEQIWLPGVHSDVGGSYPDDFLSDVALAIMIDRVFDKTDLNIDFSQLTYLLGPNGCRIVVNDEYAKSKWYETRASSAFREHGNFCETVHPFSDDLSECQIVYKSNALLTPYRQKFRNLERSAYFRSDMLRPHKIYV